MGKNRVELGRFEREINTKSHVFIIVFMNEILKWKQLRGDAKHPIYFACVTKKKHHRLGLRVIEIDNESGSLMSNVTNYIINLW